MTVALTKKSMLMISLLLVSTPVFASGGDVISLMWLMLGSFLVVLVSLFISKISIKNKIIVFGVYLAVSFICLKATSSVPYSANRIFINTLQTLLPLLAWALALGYFIKTRNKL